MELQVATPVPMEFNFDSACSSPYMTAPSSPQRLNANFLFASAPASPTRISAAFYGVPFQWDAKPPLPAGEESLEENEFEFEFSGQLDRDSFSVSAADELFAGGKIRPLDQSAAISQGWKIAAVQETRKREEFRSRSRSRSLSPMRVSDGDNRESPERFSSRFPSPVKEAASNNWSIMSAISFAKDYRRWKLKDFLFRSASEGRAPRNDDVLRAGYAVLSPKKKDSGRGSKVSSEDARNASFRSTDSAGSVSSRRRGPVSAHEMHYTANRAVSEELRRKTFLPYKRGLLGCLGFNPRVQDLSRSLGSLSRA